MQTPTHRRSMKRPVSLTRGLSPRDVLAMTAPSRNQGTVSKTNQRPNLGVAVPSSTIGQLIQLQNKIVMENHNGRRMTAVTHNGERAAATRIGPPVSHSKGSDAAATVGGNNHQR